MKPHRSRSLRISIVLAIIGAAGMVQMGANARSRSGAATAAAPAQTGTQDFRRNMPPDFMGVAGIPGWVLSVTPRTFTKESLYGYIDGGAEIVLQYGFRDLTVFELAPERPAAPGKSVTLEIYRMASRAAAFGIFSTRREGTEPVSPGIKAAHWLGRDQTGMVKGDLYVNVLAVGCDQDELERLMISLDRQLPAGETLLPRAFFCMPEFNLIRGSERYICGIAAATNESPLLGAAFWGFDQGLAEAYSVKYGPGTSKLILIHFKTAPQDLPGKVFKLFDEYLLDVSMMDQVLQGRTVVGRKFYFGANGPNGIIITDEPDPKVARARIDETLKRAAEKLRDKADKPEKPDKK